MKRFLILLFWLLMTISFFFSKHRSIYAAPPSSSTWVQTWGDEFDGHSIDATKWNKRYPYGDVQINGEQQAYIDNAFSFSNGILSIIASKANPPVQYGDFLAPYTSGIIASHNFFSQKYGYFEARAKFPKGQALWPAFWLVGPTINEIDIFEFINDASNSIYMGHHWGTDWSTDHQEHSTNYRAVNPTVDFTSDYHTYGVEWDAAKIVWYIDGVERFRSTQGIPTVAMNIRLNLAVGGDWPGSPDPNGAYPYSFNIDYVRAYQKPSLVTPSPTTPTLTPLPVTPTSACRTNLDLNCDGVINFQDVILATQKSLGGCSSMCDLNTDGKMNTLDIVTVILNIGT